MSWVGTTLIPVHCDRDIYFAFGRNSVWHKTMVLMPAVRLAPSLVLAPVLVPAPLDKDIEPEPDHYEEKRPQTYSGAGTRVDSLISLVLVSFVDYSISSSLIHTLWIIRKLEGNGLLISGAKGN